jgi:hypothetical protein
MLAYRRLRVLLVGLLSLRHLGGRVGLILLGHRFLLSSPEHVPAHHEDDRPEESRTEQEHRAQCPTVSDRIIPHGGATERSSAA